MGGETRAEAFLAFTGFPQNGQKVASSRIIFPQLPQNIVFDSFTAVHLVASRFLRMLFVLAVFVYSI
jgi:hypothetical protein